MPSIPQCTKTQSSQYSSTMVHVNSLACQIPTALPTPGKSGQKAQRDCISPEPQGRRGFCAQQGSLASQTAAKPGLMAAVCSSEW